MYMYSIYIYEYMYSMSSFLLFLLYLHVHNALSPSPSPSLPPSPSFSPPLSPPPGCKSVQTRLVQPVASSVNSSDVFVLIRDNDLFLWSSKDANVIEKARVSVGVALPVT